MEFIVRFSDTNRHAILEDKVLLHQILTTFKIISSCLGSQEDRKKPTTEPQIWQKSEKGIKS